jgi:membrane protein DedA with SNARE-associated domain
MQTAVISLVDHYGYLGILVAMTLGNLGAPVGAEVLVPIAGGLVATGHLSNVWFTIVAAVLGEMAGGGIGYAIGRFGGIPVIEKFGKYVHFKHEHLLRIHGFFDRYGTFAIFICRFIPVVRGFVGYAAGIAEMNLVGFFVWTFLGSLVFCGALVALGDVFGDHLAEILPLFHRGGMIVLGVAVVVIVAAVFIARARRRPAPPVPVE